MIRKCLSKKIDLGKRIEYASKTLEQIVICARKDSLD